MVQLLAVLLVKRIAAAAPGNAALEAGEFCQATQGCCWMMLGLADRNAVVATRHRIARSLLTIANSDSIRIQVKSNVNSIEIH